MPEVSTSLRDTQTKVQVTDSPVEDYSRAPVSTASIPGFPDTALQSKVPPVTLEEFDSVVEPDTTKPAVLTTSVPIAHHVSTARITTSHAASTVKFIDTHDLSHLDETHSFGIGPESEKNLNSALPTTVSSTALMDNSSLPENEIFPEYNSGDQGDFIFSTHEENQMNAKDLDTENRMADTEATDAKSEGLMDRKEVLGGRPVFVLGYIRTMKHFRFISKNVFGAVHGVRYTYTTYLQFFKGLFPPRSSSCPYPLKPATYP
uniref:Uncharacterized protein n=1 Tax=Naja naja TaxID=35670 RepID=A0A8C6VP35_NAJNA